MIIQNLTVVKVGVTSERIADVTLGGMRSTSMICSGPSSRGLLAAGSGRRIAQLVLGVGLFFILRSWQLGEVTESIHPGFVAADILVH